MSLDRLFWLSLGNQSEQDNTISLKKIFKVLLSEKLVKITAIYELVREVIVLIASDYFFLALINDTSL